MNEKPSAPTEAVSPQKTPREVQFQDLAGGEREVIIVLEEKKYRLLLTRNGKLILNR